MQSASINLIADLRLNTGVGEATRNLVDAILAQNITASLHELELPHRQNITDLPDRYRHLPAQPAATMNLLAYEPVLLQHCLVTDLRELLLNRYTIGYWVFELPKAPLWWRTGLTYADEIWTPSRYSAQSIAQAVNAPLHVVPNIVNVSKTTLLSRADLNLPNDRYIFYYNFDAKSSLARKNPWGVIEAFRRAFRVVSLSTELNAQHSHPPLLVIKARDIHKFPRAHQHLKQLIGAVGGMLIDTDLPRQKVDALLRHIDCYVSLHRAEGFGLGIAESMSLGKPVIATHFSANTDYLNAENGYPVQYELCPITPETHHYDPKQADTYEIGQQWAEPNIEHAAQLMREVYLDPLVAKAKGERAMRDIENYASPHAVGKWVAERLAQIEYGIFSGKIARNSHVKIASLIEIATANLKFHHEHWHNVHMMIESIPQARNPLVNRVLHSALIAFLVRFYKRVRWLGHLTYAQNDVHRATIDLLSLLNARDPERK
jgi:glycosyltransferase involved in cell wall biosynthesis